MPRPLVYYISGHGFGHASRSIELVNALLALAPQLPIHIRTGAPRWLFDLTVRGPFEFTALVTDPGVVQHDSLSLDAAETIRRADAYVRDLPALNEADLVDIPEDLRRDMTFVFARTLQDVLPVALGPKAEPVAPAVVHGPQDVDA